MEEESAEPCAGRQQAGYGALRPVSVRVSSRSHPEPAVIVAAPNHPASVLPGRLAGGLFEGWICASYVVLDALGTSSQRGRLSPPSAWRHEPSSGVVRPLERGAGVARGASGFRADRRCIIQRTCQHLRRGPIRADRSPPEYLCAHRRRLSGRTLSSDAGGPNARDAPKGIGSVLLR